MLKVCGYNKYNQLSEKSNITDKYGNFAISPSTDSSYNNPLLSSYSMYFEHAVLINSNGEMQAVGNNSDGRIIGSLFKNSINKLTTFSLKDQKGKQLYPISAVCGSYYTLFMVSYSKESQMKQLVYSSKNIKSNEPLFFDIGKSNPISIFGGNKNSAAITTNGSIIFIPIDVQTEKLNEFYLPENEKAISVACCDNFIVVSSFNGKVFKSEIKNNILNFVQVNELKKIRIIDVKGTCSHCFALSENGKVFGYGSNEWGKLGIGKEFKNVLKFTEIPALMNFSIKAASAGVGQSLFLTVDGKVLACGHNECGQRFDSNPTLHDVFLPIETCILKDATLCITGLGSSAVFIGKFPIMSPNNQSIVITPSDQTLMKGLEDKKQKNQVSTKLEKILKSKNLNIIDIDEEKQYFINEKIINTNSTSTTYKIIDKRTNTPMCKKEFNKMSLETFHEVINIFEYLRKIDHPCFCKMYGISVNKFTETSSEKGKKDDEITFSLFQEYCEHKLRDALQKMNDDNTFKAKVVLDIVHALNFLHKNQMIYRNLTVESIMFNSFYETKLADISYARITESVLDAFSISENSLAKGIGVYTPPEILNEEAYDSKSDVYSFGVILYYIFCGNLPNQTLKEKLYGKKIRLPNSSNSISKFCLELIDKCLNYRPSDRPSFDEILNLLRKNLYKLADNVDPSILSKRDKELDKFK